MSFHKTGDAQPIIKVSISKEELKDIEKRAKDLEKEKEVSKENDKKEKSN